MSQTTTILLRVRRTVVEDAYISVPITDDLVKPDEAGDLRIDFEAFVAEGLRLAGSPQTEWLPDGPLILEPHPSQGPLPEGRTSLDGVTLLGQKPTT